MRAIKTERRPQSRVLREMRERRFKTCKACQDDCGCHHYSKCELRARLARPLFTCPHGHFKPVDVDDRVRQLQEARKKDSGQ